ncbi:MAG: PLP-dependent aminotransferase family protein [Clostridia bacterium]|nr:PLP-dependent aminotransferase family protein [Clostridia bacterium]
MQFELGKKQGKALYIQLYEAISDDIMNGRLRNGAKLPSRRTMAEKLGIAENTVDGAYKMLLDTGYVESLPRQGYIVSFKSPVYSGDKPWEIIAPEDIVFSPNGIDISKVNRASYAKILKDIAYNDGMDIFSYVDKGGELILRNAISKYLYSFRDVKCSPDKIIIGAGAEYLLSSLAVLFNDTAFITENPCDTHFYRVLASYKNKTVTLPWNIGSFDIDALYKSEGDVLFIEPDARYPRSMALTTEEKEQILKWANEKDGRFIIENCCDSEITWETGRTLYSMDSNDKVVYLGSFSRSFCPAVKTSYMVLPPALLELWKKTQAYYYSLTSKTEQFALAEFINKGHFTKHYKSMRRIYKDKREYLKNCIEETFGEDVTVCTSSASTYISADFGTDTFELKKKARRYGVKLFSMSSYDAYNASNDLNYKDEDRIIIGFGELNKEQINRGIRILKEITE